MLMLVFYIYTYVGLSALLVSTNWAMRRPSNRGTSDRTGSTFFVFVCIQSFLLTVKRELLAKKTSKDEKTIYYEMHAHRSVYGNEYGCECRSH